jgi:AbrB family looped-hinge helix DNA binding protein
MTSTTILSEAGQVTIPKEVREHLGLEPFDEIEFVIEPSGVVRVQRAELTLEDVVGMFPALGLADEEVERIKEDALAEHYAAKYR